MSVTAHLSIGGVVASKLDMSGVDGGGDSGGDDGGGGINGSGAWNSHRSLGGYRWLIQRRVHALNF